MSLAADDPYRAQIDAAFAEAGVQRRMAVQTHSAVAVCAMVQAGLGLALVNPLTARACVNDRLVMVPFSVSMPYRISVLRPLHRPAQPLAEELLSALRAQVRSMRA